jgi:hypothetical protein
MTIDDVYGEEHICHGDRHLLTKACLGGRVLSGEYISISKVDTFYKRLIGLLFGYR